MPAIVLGQPVRPPTPSSTFRGFMHECLVIICISYPILLFLLTLCPGVFSLGDLSLLFLLGLTAVSTVVVSTLLSLALFILRRQCGCGDDEEDDEECGSIQFVVVDEKASIPNTPIPVGVLVVLDKA